MGQAEQDSDLPRSAGNVLAKVQSPPLFDRVAGQVDVLAGQVNFRGSLPCSEKIVQQPMLHPAPRHNKNKKNVYVVKDQ